MLVLTILKTFIEKEHDDKENLVDNRHYFDGKKIMWAGEDITSKLGQYLVLFLTLRSAKGDSLEKSFYQLKKSLQSEPEILRHRYLIGSVSILGHEKDML